MASTEHEWARRIKAAAAYAGLERQELAKRLGMSDSTLRRHLMADKRPHEIRALCQTVAEITELPEAFFTVDFARLPELADRAPAFAVPYRGDEPVEIVTTLEGGREIRSLVREAVSEELRELVAQMRPDAIQALEEALVAATRSTKQEAGEGPAAADPRENAAAADTRDEADATPAAAQAPGEAKPRSEGSTGP